MNMRIKLTKDDRNGFLFALPWIIGFLLLSVYPLVMSLYYSFTEFNFISDPKWVGLDNFESLFSDRRFFKSLGNTCFYAFVATPILLVIALLLALIANKRFSLRGVARTVFFLPSIIPMVAATMVWIWMFDPTYGYINNFLALFGIEGPAWLINPKTTKWALVMMGSWCTGTTMLPGMMVTIILPIMINAFGVGEDSQGTWIMMMSILPMACIFLAYSIYYIPKESYDMSIMFDTNEQMADELCEIVMKEIRTIAEQGPKSEDIEKNREFMLKSWQNSLELNNGWMGYIQAKYGSGLNFIADYEQALRSLTDADVQAMARKVLDDGNLVKVVMRPEKTETPAEE